MFRISITNSVIRLAESFFNSLLLPPFMFLVEKKIIQSRHLDREVSLDIFLPATLPENTLPRLLVINDGQDMEKLGLPGMLNEMYASGRITNQLFAVGVHAGERLLEYGTASTLDYLGRGYQAKNYSRFVIEELLPFLLQEYNLPEFSDRAITGFSLSALSALDIVWANPSIFNLAGVFSGSLWWRSKGLDEGYVESEDRIMHALIRKGRYNAGQRFFFEAGALDETADRNHNGIIDSIDDTLALIEELEIKGYQRDLDIRYVELPDGKHDVETWGRAMPEFLAWGWPAGKQ